MDAHLSGASAAVATTLGTYCAAEKRCCATSSASYATLKLYDLVPGAERPHTLPTQPLRKERLCAARPPARRQERESHRGLGAPVSLRNGDTRPRWTVSYFSPGPPLLYLRSLVRPRWKGWKLRGPLPCCPGAQAQPAALPHRADAPGPRRGAAARRAVACVAQRSARALALLRGAAGVPHPEASAARRASSLRAVRTHSRPDAAALARRRIGASALASRRPPSPCRAMPCSHHLTPAHPAVAAPRHPSGACAPFSDRLAQRVAAPFSAGGPCRSTNCCCTECPRAQAQRWRACATVRS